MRSHRAERSWDRTVTYNPLLHWDPGSSAMRHRTKILFFVGVYGIRMCGCTHLYVSMWKPVTGSCISPLALVSPSTLFFEAGSVDEFGVHRSG